jgi:UDP-N-acetylmuramoyl-tripeptide--D-alanyl-D-alanine ligase
MMELSWVAEVLKAQGGGTRSGQATSVCTDTREATPGCLFFALQGENSDGHAYVADAFAKGAVAAVVAHPVENATGAQLVVPETLRALGDLARAYRRQFRIPVVGVTGSVGKTTTKEMVAAVLRARYVTLANAQNFNNEIGVPRTLFQLTSAHQVAVIEMGMRGLGEIDRLAEIAEPQIGLITKIGYAHIERLGSQEKIAEAKTELLQRLPDEGVAILPLHSPFADYMMRRAPRDATLVTFSTEATQAADVRLVRYRDASEGGFEVSVGGVRARLRLKAVGEHLAENALAALAVGAALGVPTPQAIAALEAWEGAEGRMVVRPLPGGGVLLDDCYNAGPESMEAALKTLSRLTQGGGAAILGDMKELGDYASEIHQAVGRHVIEADVRLLVTVGELAEEISEGAARWASDNGFSYPARQHFATTAQATQAIADLIRPGETVLVKGSRAMQMERIVAALTGEAEAGGHG